MTDENLAQVETLRKTNKNMRNKLISKSNKNTAEILNSIASEAEERMPKEDRSFKVSQTQKSIINSK